jgi:hypothetical protein
MFEPQELITVALAAILIAPFCFVFWRIAIYQPGTEAEVRARVESLVQERPKEISTTQADGSFVTGDTFLQVESIGFSTGTMSWLSFFPRRWVGRVLRRQ